MRDVQGKVAVVTGAASGIGRGMAEAFAAGGMKLVLADIDERALDATRRALQAMGADAHAVRTDVTKQEDLDGLAKETLRVHGAVHVLCNNAGIGGMRGDTPGGGASWESPLEDWQWIVGVNLMGVVHGIRAFLPIMIRQGTEAHVVNTASLAGLVAAGTLYGTTKFAVVGLSENLSLELQRGGYAPKVSVLCPGLVATQIADPERARPTEFGTARPDGPVVRAAREWFAEEIKKGMSPRAVGDQVLAAIREERFYILTHPEFNPVIEQRVRNLLSGGNPVAVWPPPRIESLLKADGDT